MLLFCFVPGRLLLSAGRYQEAYEVLTHGVRVYPSAALYLTLGMAGGPPSPLPPPPPYLTHYTLSINAYDWCNK